MDPGSFIFLRGKNVVSSSGGGALPFEHNSCSPQPPNPGLLSGASLPPLAHPLMPHNSLVSPFSTYKFHLNHTHNQIRLARTTTGPFLSRHSAQRGAPEVHLSPYALAS